MYFRNNSRLKNLLSTCLVFNVFISKLFINFSHRVSADIDFFLNQNIKNKRNNKKINTIKIYEQEKKIKDQNKFKFFGH